MHRIFTALGILVVCGCHSLSPNRIKADGREEMHLALTERIPNGTALDEARSKMEAAGFDCVLLADSFFTEAPGFIDDESDYKSVANARMLRCTRSESAGLLMAHIWAVALVLDQNDKVEDVLVLHRMEGP